MMNKQIEKLHAISSAGSESYKAPADTGKLVDSLRSIMASTFFLYYKAHAIHWNVEGIEFPQYHHFFDELYNSLHSAVDPIAEHIRALNVKAPATIAQLQALMGKADQMNDNSSLGDMLLFFDADNNRLIELLKMGISNAGTAGEPAVQNFLQDRLDAHQKLGWMIRSVRM